VLLLHSRIGPFVDPTLVTLNVTTPRAVRGAGIVAKGGDDYNFSMQRLYTCRHAGVEAVESRREQLRQNEFTSRMFGTKHRAER
jgi:hypothetical protein